MVPVLTEFIKYSGVKNFKEFTSKYNELVSTMKKYMVPCGYIRGEINLVREVVGGFPVEKIILEPQKALSRWRIGGGRMKRYSRKTQNQV